MDLIMENGFRRDFLKFFLKVDLFIKNEKYRSYYIPMNFFGASINYPGKIEDVVNSELFVIFVSQANPVLP